MPAAFCTKCGGPIGPADRFCASCGTSVGETPVEATPPEAAPPATAASLPGLPDTSALSRFGRIAKTVALLAFLLPWVTVSCAGQTIASVSGVRLATGAVTIRNPASGAIETHAATANWALLAAALAIALALLVSFIPARRIAALLGVALSAAAAVLAVYAVMIEIPQELAAGFRDRPAAGDFDASLTHSIDHALRVDSAIGFWLALLALGIACALDWQVNKRARRQTG